MGEKIQHNDKLDNTKKSENGHEAKKQQTPCGLTIDAGYGKLVEHLQECQKPECKKEPLW